MPSKIQKEDLHHSAGSSILYSYIIIIIINPTSTTFSCWRGLLIIIIIIFSINEFFWDLKRFKEDSLLSFILLLSKYILEDFSQN